MKTGQILRLSDNIHIISLLLHFRKIAYFCNCEKKDELDF